jgi:hypothetical protein
MAKSIIDGDVPSPKEFEFADAQLRSGKHKALLDHIMDDAPSPKEFEFAKAQLRAEGKLEALFDFSVDIDTILPQLIERVAANRFLEIQIRRMHMI